LHYLVFMKNSSFIKAKNVIIKMIEISFKILKNFAECTKKLFCYISAIPIYFYPVEYFN